MSPPRIYRHKGHGYQVRYRIWFPDGSAKIKYRYYRNRVEADLAAQEILQFESKSKNLTLEARDIKIAFEERYITKDEAALLGRGPATTATLKDLLVDLEKAGDREWRPSSKHRNLYKAKEILEHLGGLSLGEITKEKIWTYMDERLREGVKPRTINIEFYLLRKWLDLAVAKGMLQHNPAMDIKKLKEERPDKAQALTREQIRSFLAHCLQISSDLLDIILVALNTGLRRGELLNLESSQIDLRRRTLFIPGAKAKSKKGRTVGLNPAALAVLQSRMEKRWIFQHPELDRPIWHPNHLSGLVARAMRNAGIEGQSLKSLRHTYITYLLDAGIPVQRVRDRAGHHSISVTDIYSHSVGENEVLEDRLDFDL